MNNSQDVKGIINDSLRPAETAETAAPAHGTDPHPPDHDATPGGDPYEPTGAALDHHDQPRADLGLNPIRVRARSGSYIRDLEDWWIQGLELSLRKHDSPIPAGEREKILAQIRTNIPPLLMPTIRFGVVSKLMVNTAGVVGVLGILAPLVLIWAVAEAGVSTFMQVVAGMLGVLVCAVWSYAVVQLIRVLPVPMGGLRTDKGRPAITLQVNLGPATLIFILAAITFGLVTAPRRFQAAPNWLASGWMHAGLTAAAWSIVLVATFSLIGQLILRLHWAAVLWRINRNYPREYLIERLTGFALYLWGERGKADSPIDTFETRLHLLEGLERIATDFEQNWHRRAGAGHPRAHHLLRRQARQIGGSVRAQQAALLRGEAFAEVGTKLMDTVAGIVLNRPFPEPPLEERAYRKVAWWRLTGKMAVALLLLCVTILLILMAVWQPGLPDFFESLGLGVLSDLTRVPPPLRPGVLGAAVAIFGLFVRVVAPQNAGERPGRTA